MKTIINYIKRGEFPLIPRMTIGLLLLSFFAPVTILFLLFYMLISNAQWVYKEKLKETLQDWKNGTIALWKGEIKLW